MVHSVKHANTFNVYRVTSIRGTSLVVSVSNENGEKNSVKKRHCNSKCIPRF